MHRVSWDHFELFIIYVYIYFLAVTEETELYNQDLHIYLFDTRMHTASNKYVASVTKACDVGSTETAVAVYICKLLL